MTSLYGTLIAHLAADYEKQTSALHKNTALINRFGEEMKRHDLAPHVNTVDSANIRFVGGSKRGRDNQALFDALKDSGYNIGAAEKTPQQFTDGYVMWLAPITSRALSFTLLFYTEEDVS
jgi:hypothetical protein